MRLNTRVSIRASDATAFVDGLRQAGIRVEDTGERVTTDEGLDGEVVFAVLIPPAPARDEKSPLVLPA